MRAKQRASAKGHVWLLNTASASLLVLDSHEAELPPPMMVLPKLIFLLKVSQTLLSCQRRLLTSAMILLILSALLKAASAVLFAEATSSLQLGPQAQILAGDAQLAHVLQALISLVYPRVQLVAQGLLLLLRLAQLQLRAQARGEHCNLTSCSTSWGQ